MRCRAARGGRLSVRHVYGLGLKPISRHLRCQVKPLVGDTRSCQDAAKLTACRQEQDEDPRDFPLPLSSTDVVLECHISISKLVDQRKQRFPTGGAGNLKWTSPKSKTAGTAICQFTTRSDVYAVSCLPALSVLRCLPLLTERLPFTGSLVRPARPGGVTLILTSYRLVVGDFLRAGTGCVRPTWSRGAEADAGATFARPGSIYSRS